MEMHHKPIFVYTLLSLFQWPINDPIRNRHCPRDALRRWSIKNNYDKNHCGMQDFNYVWYGCMEVTLELSCCKYPPATELPKLWEENRLSLVKFLAEAHRGVHGFVMDEHGNPVEKASLKVKGRDVGFQTTKYGEFWRIILPGIYKLEVYADDYVPREVDFMVVDQHPTLLNVTLHPSKVGQVPKGNHKAWKPPWLPSPRSSHKFVGSWWHAGERGDRLPSWETNTDFGGGFNGSKTKLASSSGVADSHVWAAFCVIFFTIYIVTSMSFS